MVHNRRLGKGGTLTVEDHKTEVVRRFKYLGTVINDSNNEMEEIWTRILAPNKAYSSVNTSEASSINYSPNVILILVRTESLQNCQKYSVYQSTNVCKLWKQNANFLILQMCRNTLKHRHTSWLQYVFLHVTVYLTSLHFYMTPVTVNCNSTIQQSLVQCSGLGGVTTDG